MIQKQQNNNLAKLQRRKTRLQTAIEASTSDSNRAGLEDKMFYINNQILEVEYDIKIEVKVPLTKEEKGEWKTNKKAYGERLQKHLLNQQKSFALSLVSVRNAYKIRCTTITNKKTLTKSKIY